MSYTAHGTFVNSKSKQPHYEPQLLAMLMETCAAAAEYLNRAVPNPGTQFFAYPYGETSDYLIHEYLPAQTANPFVLAAFGTQGGVMTEASNRWHLPRYVCGFHWKTPEAFAEVLRDAK